MMTQVTDSAYNALKIVLLASLQRSHAATLSELETIIDELEVTDPSARDLQQLLASINLDISSYGFEVKQVRFKDETYVGYVNKEADASASRASTGYRTKEGKPDTQITAFFRALLDAIAVSEGDVPTVSDQDAYYMPIAAGNQTQEQTTQGQTQQEQTQQETQQATVSMSLGERQKALDALVKDGWLSREGEDAVGLGPRSLLELHQMVLQTDGVSEEARTFVNTCLGLN